MKVKNRIRKVSERFAREFLDDIKIKRIQNGIDKKLISDARITEGMLRDPDIVKMKERLSRLPRIDDLK